MEQKQADQENPSYAIAVTVFYANLSPPHINWWQAL